MSAPIDENSGSKPHKASGQSPGADVPSSEADPSPDPLLPDPQWFDRPDHDTGQAGLRFACTMCGNCCTGDGGYVKFTPAEASALALRLGVTVEAFIRTFTHDTSAGRSLKEKTSDFGQDCIFLDRNSMPGRAVCGVYEDRPSQCKTWPFWESNIAAPWAWARASALCPGMNKGQRYSPQQIRILRDVVEM